MCCERSPPVARNICAPQAVRPCRTSNTIFGYQNVEVHTAEGKRSHVERAIDPAQATIVARIFADYAAGFGFGRIAKRLNAEGVPAPRARGVNVESFKRQAIDRYPQRESGRCPSTWRK